MERVLRKALPNGFSGVSVERSRMMSKVKSKGNKSTELRLRLALVRAGLKGWKMHPNNIPGRPDFYFYRQRVAIFVDGCFWHACKRCGHMPRVRSSFWQLKFQRNRRRARIVARDLGRERIVIARFWEHDVRQSSNRVARKIAKLLFL
jgi:DNA mismatch endonuclease (patch repair protein)